MSRSLTGLTVLTDCLLDVRPGREVPGSYGGVAYLFIRRGRGEDNLAVVGVAVRAFDVASPVAASVVPVAVDLVHGPSTQRLLVLVLVTRSEWVGSGEVACWCIRAEWLACSSTRSEALVALAVRQSRCHTGHMGHGGIVT